MSATDLTVDVAFGHAVVVCRRPGCAWRTTRGTRAAAWTAGAQHLKAPSENGGHDDVHAAHTARKCARVAGLRARSQSPDTRKHGTSRPSTDRRQPAGSRRPGERPDRAQRRSAG
ncbi:hypothetical protein PQC63_gp03 [Gordonia phage EricDab]|uniref:Uncharacterized protein n=1 Tax=Gordonia phage EricDab TaxID=3070616 RepID=A0A4D6E3U5_9CAUD|nr:hypothetical protein PQC63_gp03 [Gordonia phage EricDab]QBZ73174.1 hypothetical protein SEA_EPICDAB_3 [Gordonia phage EricDab]